MSKPTSRNIKKHTFFRNDTSKRGVWAPRSERGHRKWEGVKWNYYTTITRSLFPHGCIPPSFERRPNSTRGKKEAHLRLSKRCKSHFPVNRVCYSLFYLFYFFGEFIFLLFSKKPNTSNYVHTRERIYIRGKLVPFRFPFSTLKKKRKEKQRLYSHEIDSVRFRYVLRFAIPSELVNDVVKRE